ncbi:hypothetical protein VNO78_23526 [Psophocarpus tetragonolobus]|uniref:Uncharacterized protein n=1 Tax=Psophocarpus tetragonolobus TaxID=3891 RepID=A0AAN9S3A1_PSOTE
MRQVLFFAFFCNVLLLGNYYSYYSHRHYCFIVSLLYYYVTCYFTQFNFYTFVWLPYCRIAADLVVVVSNLAVILLVFASFLSFCLVEIKVALSLSFSRFSESNKISKAFYSPVTVSLDHLSSWSLVSGRNGICTTALIRESPSHVVSFRDGRILMQSSLS